MGQVVLVCRIALSRTLAATASKPEYWIKFRHDLGSKSHARSYMICNTNSFSVDLYSEKVFNQQMDFIHNIPARAGMCNLPEAYKYS